jgi:hypothetical protein
MMISALRWCSLQTQWYRGWEEWQKIIDLARDVLLQVSECCCIEDIIKLWRIHVVKDSTSIWTVCVCVFSAPF